MTTLTGTIQSVKMQTREPYMGQSRYSRGTHTEYFLNIQMITNDGLTVYFNSPAATQSVSVAPGIAVIIYLIEGKAKTWLKETGENKVSVPGVKNDNKLESLVNEGDIITIDCRVTECTSKVGKKYLKATHCKLIK